MSRPGITTAAAGALSPKARAPAGASGPGAPGAGDADDGPEPPCLEEHRAPLEHSAESTVSCGDPRLFPHDISNLGLSVWMHGHDGKGALRIALNRGREFGGLNTGHVLQAASYKGEARLVSVRSNDSAPEPGVPGRIRRAREVLRYIARPAESRSTLGTWPCCTPTPRGRT